MVIKHKNMKIIKCRDGPSRNFKSWNFNIKEMRASYNY